MGSFLAIPLAILVSTLLWVIIFEHFAIAHIEVAARNIHNWNIILDLLGVAYSYALAGSCS